ncbi:hypothetical protein, partial [Chryseosolibacter indicus]
MIIHIPYSEEALFYREQKRFIRELYSCYAINSRSTGCDCRGSEFKSEMPVIYFGPKYLSMTRNLKLLMIGR